MMVGKFELLLMVVSTLIVLVKTFNYCTIPSCHKYTHTLCRFPFYGVARRCGEIQRIGLTDFEKWRIVELHNRFREYVYSGREARGNPGPQPAAINIQYMHWDEELAFAAQRWSEQCINGIDLCRNVERFLVSQNVGRESTNGNVEALLVDWTVRKWYEEVKNFNRSDVRHYRYRDNFNETAHYTKMIWADTNKIGCGGIRYNDRYMNRFFLVCNYGPSGNIFGQAVY